VGGPGLNLAILDRATHGYANEGQGTRDNNFTEVIQFFFGSLSVSMQSQIPAAVVRYTTDGPGSLVVVIEVCDDSWDPPIFLKIGPAPPLFENWAL